MTELDGFLAGERPEDVVIFLGDAVLEADSALYDMGTATDDGVVLVVEGERGRSAFESATGLDPMAFAKDAMGTKGPVDTDCTGGTCPAAEAGGDHAARYVFAFAEAQNEEAGGLYAEGDVVHAYVACSCGETYADKWVAGER